MVVSILDYGAGNIGSIVNMIKYLGGESRVISNANQILSAERLILPGVGHFDHCMSKLSQNDLSRVLIDYIKEKERPVLGICVGAQMMTNGSEEGRLPGLGLFDASVVHFSKLVEGFNLRVPHMGWNEIDICLKNEFTSNMYEKSRFYFVHSYFLKSNVEKDIMFRARYGDFFTAGLQRDNLYAVQFHPEKSHKYGKRIFENFLKI